MRIKKCHVAETIDFAHGKHVIHRSLSPRSILVVNPESGNPQSVIVNWPLGYHQAVSSRSSALQQVTAAIHVDKLAEETMWVFTAPEALLDFDTLGEHYDIFSLGTLCYQPFTEQTPAESPLGSSRAARDAAIAAVVVRRSAASVAWPGNLRPAMASPGQEDSRATPIGALNAALPPILGNEKSYIPQPRYILPRSRRYY